MPPKTDRSEARDIAWATKTLTMDGGKVRNDVVFQRLHKRAILSAARRFGEA